MSLTWQGNQHTGFNYGFQNGNIQHDRHNYDTQHSNIQHYGLNCDSQRNNILHNASIATLSTMTFWIMGLIATLRMTLSMMGLIMSLSIATFRKIFFTCDTQHNDTWYNCLIAALSIVTFSIRGLI